MVNLDRSPDLVLDRAGDHIVPVEPDVDALAHEAVPKFIHELRVLPRVRDEAAVDHGTSFGPGVEDPVLKLDESCWGQIGAVKIRRKNLPRSQATATKESLGNPSPRTGQRIGAY